MKKLKTALPDTLLLTGCALLVAGAAIVWPPAAFFSGGALLIALGLLLGQSQRGGDGK